MIDEMGNFSKQLEKREERIEKDKLRKEKLAEFFFSLSNTVFGSLVIGVTLLLLEAESNYNVYAVCIMLAAGLVIFIVMAKIGNNILK